MSTQNQINLKERTLPELKALAFDLQRIVNNYTQMYNTVMQELSQREQEATLAQSAPSEVAVASAVETEPEAPAPKKKSKLTKV